MLGFIKSIFYICLVLLGLLIAGVIFLVFFVNPNQYKAEIINNIQNSTGRSLVIAGKMQWTFYPMLGIKVNDLKLGNPPSFPKTDFLSVKDADISVAFRPLLNGQIQVDKIILNYLKLDLIKNASGQVNWQNHVSTSNHRVETQNVASPQKDNNNFFKLALLTIGEVDLKDSSIVYEDEKQNKKIILDQLQLKSKNIALNKFFPIETSFMIKTNKISKPISITLNANMLVNMDKLRLQGLDAKTNQYHWAGWLEINFLKKDLAALNGYLSFSGKNGAFQGIDLYYYSNLADAMINQTEPTRQDTHQTPFDSIQGTLDIQDGIVNNHDLFIHAQRINASGQGTVNLVNQALDYQISLQRLTNGTQVKSRGPVIPLLVTGTISDPKIRPDWTSITVTEIKSQIKEKIEKHKDQIPESIQRGLQNLLRN